MGLRLTSRFCVRPGRVRVFRSRRRKTRLRLEQAATRKSHICITVSSRVKGKLISVRLDLETEYARAVLMRDGQSRSDAIREALIESARRRGSDALRAEAEAAGADPVDRAEAAAVLKFMESMREPWLGLPVARPAGVTGP